MELFIFHFRESNTYFTLSFQLNQLQNKMMLLNYFLNAVAGFWQHRISRPNYNILAVNPRLSIKSNTSVLDPWAFVSLFLSIVIVLYIYKWNGFDGYKNSPISTIRNLKRVICWELARFDFAISEETSEMLGYIRREIGECSLYLTISQGSLI